MSKKTSLLIYFAALLLVFGGTLTSCNKDNESDSEVARLKALLLDDQGQIIFDRTTTSGLYQIGLFSLDDARNLATLYAGDGFNGKAYTHSLGKDKGSVQVSVGNNGVYYQIHFDVTGVPSFTLDIADGSQGGNSFEIHHTCSVCGFEWMSTFNNRCPRAKDKKYHP